MEPFNMVVDDTFNDELHETTLSNMVNPVTLDDEHVVALFNIVVPETFNADINVWVEES